MPQGVASAWEDVRRHVGSHDQLVRVDRAELTDGPGAGSPVLIVRNPGGISFEVLLDRALDIGWADAGGIPLAWAAPRGRVASVRHEPAGSGWVRTFGGGLLTTCGLAATGAPSTVDGTEHGLHGRIGHIPASHVRWQLAGEGEQAHLEIVGEVIEAALGQPTLHLTRTIRARLHAPAIEIEDVVRNDGFVNAPHMFRHHLNLGYPLVTGSATIQTDAVAFGLRGGGAAPALADIELATAEAPVDERVIYATAGASGALSLTSPAARAALSIEWSAPTFPLLVVWRDASPGVNVLGIEPSTSRDDGRAEAERTGELVVLAPGEHRRYLTRISLDLLGSATESTTKNGLA